MQGILAMRIRLLIVPQFHVMAGVSLPMFTLVLIWYFPPLQLKRLLIFKKKKKITKANGVPTSGWGLSRNEAKPTQRELVLKEYFGGSALPKSLIEGFDKDFGIKGVQAWE
jgi:fatty-acyl-CoA synthase